MPPCQPLTSYHPLGNPTDPQGPVPPTLTTTGLEVNQLANVLVNLCLSYFINYLQRRLFLRENGCEKHVMSAWRVGTCTSHSWAMVEDGGVVILGGRHQRCGRGVPGRQQAEFRCLSKWHQALFGAVQCSQGGVTTDWVSTTKLQWGGDQYITFHHSWTTAAEITRA